MFFNFPLFFQFIQKAFFMPRGNYRLTLRRLGVLTAFLICYIPHEILAWLSFLGDEIFFPGYRREKVEAPLFIIGNFRSGTTFLQRLILEDKKQTTGMTAGEIIFAPSLLQRQLFRGLWAVDRRLLGSFITKIVQKFNERTVKKVDFHRFRWNDYEEDDFVLFHSFSTFGLWLYSVPWEVVKPLMRFDKEVSAPLRQKIMKTYKRLIQRHVYFHRGKLLISKNPTCSPKIESLREQFPQARFVYLLRDPQEVIPSQRNMIAKIWHWTASPREEYPCPGEVEEMAEEWYDYPLKKLKELPQDRWMVVHYDHLTANPQGTVENIYRHFHIPLSGEFQEKLKQHSRHSKKHSRKTYPLEAMGLDTEEIRRRFSSFYSETPSTK